MPTWTEKWRHETEARHVASLDWYARDKYLEGVARHRGTEWARRLRADAVAELF